MRWCWCFFRGYSRDVAAIQNGDACDYKITSWNGHEAVYTLTCPYGDQGGGGSGYPDPIGGGGGDSLPPLDGYRIKGNVYVRLDGKVILAAHAYTCGMDYEVLQGVASWSAGPVGWEVEIRMAGGNQTWKRINGHSTVGWQAVSPCT